MRKKKVVKTDYLANHKELLKAISWCFKNNIRVFPIPDKHKYRIVVESGSEVIKSPLSYEKEELDERIWNIYHHYYTKNN